MSILKLIFVLIKILPELIKLYNKFEKDISDEAERKQLEQDKEAIRNAFKNKDANMLNAVFDNRRLRKQTKSD